jgi:Fe-S oxidoreductase
MGQSLQKALQNLKRHGNSFGASAKARPRWTQQLKFSIKDARKEPVQYLWFVGDYASFDPRAAKATCAAARVFRKAGLDFGILYESEHNSGTDVRLAGEEKLFEILRDKNLDAFARAHFDGIITTDPHSFHVLKHYTELLSNLILDGTLPLRHKLRMRVTYHDPCYLGRYNAIFHAPRRVIAALGLKLIEMPLNRTYAYCCGAGGGRIWREAPPVFQERPAVTRVREAATLKGVHTLVVVCPKDLVMFQDAIQTAGLEDRLQVKDLSELVEQAMG